jgi:arylsulfatase A-like enzyme
LGLLFGALTGVLDALSRWRTVARGEWTAAEIWSLIAVDSTFCALTLGLFAAVYAVVLPALLKRDRVRRLLGYTRAGPSRWFAADPHRTAQVLQTLVGTLASMAIGYRFSLGVLRAIRTPSLAALALVLLGACALVLGVVASAVVADRAHTLAQRYRQTLTVGAVFSTLLLVLVAGLSVVALLKRSMLSAMHVQSWVVLLAAIAGFVMIDARTTRRAHPALTVLLTVATLSGVIWSAKNLDRSQHVLGAVTAQSSLAATLITVLQQWTDRDHDGYGRYFGGGDCNDSDPMTNPMAPEIAGNGRDENCSGFDAPPPPEDRLSPFVAPASSRPSVVLISIDTVRPDHTSLYGYHRRTTPHLDVFARDAARFDHAYAVAPQTVRSFASAFTGRAPASLCWGRDVQFPPLRDPNELLAEVLQTEGYDTAAFTNTSYFGLTAGFFQGFAQIEQGGGFKDDATVCVDHSRSWIEQAARRTNPFFAWVHLVDPHEPYTDRSAPEEFGHQDVDRYDEEIAHADRAMGRLLPALDAIARSRPLIVIVMSDHGEGFGEHGVYFHSYDAHEEALRVLLVMRGPGVVAGGRNALVSLMDLYPTILGYVGRTPTLRSPARSLIPLLQSQAESSVPWRGAVFADVSPAGDLRATSVALIAPPWKLLHDGSRNAWELYQLDRDAQERHNLFDRERGIAEVLRARLADLARPSIAHCPRR